MKLPREYDEKSILEKSVFEELYSIRSAFDREDRRTALMEHAYSLSKECGDAFKRRDKAYKQDIEKSQKESQSIAQNRQTDFGYFEDGHELNCGNWIANRDGILRYNPYGIAENACYHPILITQLLTNIEKGTQKVKIAWLDEDEWRELIVSKKNILNPQKMEVIGEYGADVSSDNAKLLVKYFRDLERRNVGMIERKVSTGKFGWIRGDFVPYGMNVEFDNRENFKELFDSVAERGSFEKWMECVKEVRKSGRKEPIVYLAGSFASVILPLLDLPSFVLNLWEESGRGKTVSMMVAASVWGDPKIGRFMTDIADTGTTFEVRSDVLNHLPLLIDDLSKVKEAYKDNFTDLVYAWCGNKGKGRSNVNLGMQIICTWNNITMTCYERPLATETMRGGAVNRILDFQMEPGAIFTKETGNATVSIITKNYGFAGKMFVDLIKDIGIPKIKELQRFYLKEIDDYCEMHNEEKEDKQKLPLSILLVADKLTADHIFKDGIYLDFEWCMKQLKGKDDVSENQRAYESIMDDVSIHVNNFNPDDSGNYRGEFWGGIKNGYVYIIPAIFDQMASRYNFSSKAFLQWAKQNELLLYDKNKNQKTERIPTGSTGRKFYAIKIKEDTSEDVGASGNSNSSSKDEKDEFIQVDDQMELPFD